MVNVLHFTCLPGTLNTYVSEVFMRANDQLPWENLACDGQSEASIENRLQAFMRQAREYSKRKNLHELAVLA
jgi:hypothetical protein